MEPRTSPRDVLREDHERIDALLRRLVDTLRAEDRDVAAQLWTNVEEALLRHFDVEEMFVFPALGDSFSADVAVLRAEHADLRRALGEIGLAFDIHAARCEPVEALCTRLRAHAAREDALAYREVTEHLAGRAARSLVDRVRGVARSIHRDRGHE
jgi:hypothetical protein